MDPDVDKYISHAKTFQESLKALRKIILDCGLEEELKWKQPCYTFNKKNILIIGELKNYCVLSFFKGVLLADTANILVKPGENSQAAKLIRFTEVKQIMAMEAVLKTYIFEAIEIEKAGMDVIYKKEQEPLPNELKHKFNSNPAFEKAFNALTPGRQRGYILYFSKPKHSKSRTSRIEKYVERILDGKGFNDCICGLSKKMPNCDGSHKLIQMKGR